MYVINEVFYDDDWNAEDEDATRRSRIPGIFGPRTVPVYGSLPDSG
jgi:hypothetical protein